MARVTVSLDGSQQTVDVQVASQQSVKHARYASGNEYPLSNTARRKLIIFQGAWHSADAKSYKSANPTGLALCYVNAIYSSVWGISPMGSTLLSRAQAQAIGAETGQKHYDGWHYQCDVGLGSYHSQAVQNLRQLLFGTYAWDGIFLDDVNWASNQVGVPAGYLSYADWRDKGLVPLLSALRQAFPDKLILANMNGTWGQWANSPDSKGFRPLMPYLDGGLDEFFSGIWPDGKQVGVSFVREALKAADYCQANGKIHMPVTQLASPTDSQRAKFGYCLALIALGDRTFYNAHREGYDVWDGSFDLDIGAPTGPRAETSSGVWSRSFTKATVTADANSQIGTIVLK